MNDNVLLLIFGIVLILFSGLEWYSGEAYDVFVVNLDERFILQSDDPQSFFHAVALKAIGGGLLIAIYCITLIQKKKS